MNSEDRITCPFRLRERTVLGQTGCYCDPGLARLEAARGKSFMADLLNIYKRRLERKDYIEGRPYVKMGCNTPNYCNFMRSSIFENVFDQEDI